MRLFFSLLDSRTLSSSSEYAALYLVPCCLVGTMCFMAYQRNEIYSLWDGPKAIRTVNDMLYGVYEGKNSNNQHIPVPLEEGQQAHAAPSAQDENGDAALPGKNRNVV